MKALRTITSTTIRLVSKPAALGTVTTVVGLGIKWI